MPAGISYWIYIEILFCFGQLNELVSQVLQNNESAQINNLFIIYLYNNLLILYHLK